MTSVNHESDRETVSVTQRKTKYLKPLLLEYKFFKGVFLCICVFFALYLVLWNGSAHIFVERMVKLYNIKHTWALVYRLNYINSKIFILVSTVL